METAVLFAIGLAAFGYCAYLVWRSINGKEGCNCGAACQSAETCHYKAKNSPE